LAASASAFSLFRGDTNTEVGKVSAVHSPLATALLMVPKPTNPIRGMLSFLYNPIGFQSVVITNVCGLFGIMDR
jgi:hypothetical protein